MCERAAVVMDLAVDLKMSRSGVVVVRNEKLLRLRWEKWFGDEESEFGV
jgi:hypothetical protein